MTAYVLIAMGVGAAIVAIASARTLTQCERGVQFRPGRVENDGVRGPGLIVILPLLNRLHRVSLRIVTIAQTTLRAADGRHTLDETLSDTQKSPTHCYSVLTRPSACRVSRRFVPSIGFF
jgi:regulator of protease activity HflC (stomatin/prohibitin superfamily)